MKIKKLLGRGKIELVFVVIGLIVLVAVGGGGYTISADQGPSRIHLTWSTNDVYHTITVSWWTPSSGGDLVSYDKISYDGRVSGYVSRIEGVHNAIRGFNGWYHHVELTGLEPGTTYFFVCGGPVTWSEEYSFRTIGNDEQVSFVLGGDSRRPWGEEEIKDSPTAISNWPHARNWVSATMAEESPNFAIFIGDIVESGDSQEQWHNWFDMVQEHWVTPDGRMIPLVPVIGNHEMGSYPRTNNTYDYFTGLFSLSGNELWYSLDFPDLHLTVLCASGGGVKNLVEDLRREATQQKEWLKEDLSNTKAKWKIVTFHIPPYSSYGVSEGRHGGPTREHWVPIFEKYGVDVVACGHVHNYERTWPMKGFDTPRLQRSSEDGVTYVVQGGWGAPTDPFVKDSPCRIRYWDAACAARPCYTLVELTDEGLYLLTKDTNGDVLDDIRLPYRTADFPTPEYNFRI